LARRILLADDSVTAQNMGRRILTDAGYEVVTVNNGSAALKKILEQKPDLIVLDVYMPGYGGLEVCQRLKETSETTRIPVLLTVGKLEPFKPDEAKRVGADAFIVKPFEASELLTALTKLEDKIVPQAQPPKSGRFAKALAAIEQSSDDRFGDRETGWKERLIIPTPTGRQEQTPAVTADPVAARPAQASQREAFRPAEPKEFERFERPIPTSLPADITAEEVAAISAAAAAFAAGAPGGERVAVVGSPEPQSEAIAEPTAEAESVPEATAAAPAPEVESAAAQISEAPSAISPGTLQTETALAVQGSRETAREEAIAGSAVDDAKESRPRDGEANWNKDAEVLAALASLAPVEAPRVGVAETDEKSGVSQAVQQIQAPAETPVAIASSTAGPRWIAEAITVTAEESSLVLEQEMEKALAAVAVAGAHVEIPVSLESATVGAIQPLEPARAAIAEAKSVPAESLSSLTEASESQPARSMVEEAYAAAAAAGSAIEGTTEPLVSSMLAAAPARPPEATPASSGQGGLQDAELAAAWQNWKEIRETVVGSETSAEAAETATPEATKQVSQPMQVEPMAEPVQPIEQESEKESATDDDQEEPAAIASIVDSMLAELRPKLVEEITRKMSSAKKAKGKKSNK
jgi:twitching motility two-component system response regulator PilH